jgi:hypothetical protein
MIQYHQPPKAKYDKLSTVDGDGEKEWIVDFLFLLLFVFLQVMSMVGFYDYSVCSFLWLCFG